MVHLIYVDDTLIVLNKPSGLLSVPGRGIDGQDCLSSRVQQQFADALIVHRLDMGTSGLLIMARGLDHQRSLQRQFAQGLVQKGYVAVVQGIPQVAPMQWQCIDAPLRLDWPNRPRSIVDFENGKPCRTHWRLLEQSEAHPALAQGWFQPLRQQLSQHAEYAVLELKPETGRTHQIRVHLQSIGHTIAGDALYGDTANQAMAARLMLHAWHLALRHPRTGQMLQWQCPADFKQRK